MINSGKVYPVVTWREYLDPSKSKRVKRFLKTNGTRVFTNLIDTMETTFTGKTTKKIVVLVHPNVSSLIIIDESDYIEILNHIMFYFKSIEDYIMCGRIKKLIESQRELCNINLNLEDGKQHHKIGTKGKD